MTPDFDTFISLLRALDDMTPEQLRKCGATAPIDNPVIPAKIYPVDQFLNTPPHVQERMWREFVSKVHADQGISRGAAVGVPLVLWFKEERGRDEFIDIWKEAYPGHSEVVVP